MKPPGWWSLFGEWLALDVPGSARLWNLVSTSHRPSIRAWRLTAVYAASHGGGRAHAVSLLSGPLSPRRVIEMLEQLVDERRLTRQEANAMEASVLSQTSAVGAWT